MGLLLRVAPALALGVTTKEGSRARIEVWTENRVLQPGAPLLVGFHVGAETVHRDELFGEAVSLDFRFFEVREIEAAMAAAGLMVLERCERAPYEGVEHPSRRGYLLATANGRAGGPRPHP